MSVSLLVSLCAVAVAYIYMYMYMCMYVHVAESGQQLCMTHVKLVLRTCLTSSLPACSAPEPQVIDYQTQQYKLFPLIASAYAFLFSGAELREIYFRTNSEIQQGNVDMLPEVSAVRHAA